jgi:dipeptidyl aminopeptidase/acylaminoacyl peptidase
VSADGQWVVYDSNRGGNQDIYKQSVSGGEPQALTTHLGDDFAPDWSPDGEQILFHSLRNGNRDVFLLAADGGTPVVALDGPNEQMLAKWSPDGGDFMYVSGGRSTNELRVVSRSNDGVSWQPRATIATGVTTTRAGWSPDGERIGYALARRVAIVPAGGGGGPCSPPVWTEMWALWSGRATADPCSYRLVPLQGRTVSGPCPRTAGLRPSSGPSTTYSVQWVSFDGLVTDYSRRWWRWRATFWSWKS